MTKHFASIVAVLAACATAHHVADADPQQPGVRCPPGNPHRTRCIPTNLPPPPPGPPPGQGVGPPPSELVDPSVTTVVTTTIDGTVTRAVAGRNARGAFITIEKLADGRVMSRTALRFEGLSDVPAVDVLDLHWVNGSPGALSFHIGETVGDRICHVAPDAAVARCVVARGGGRPSR